MTGMRHPNDHDEHIAATKPQITHRIELVLGVQADDDEAAGKIAEAFYEKFAKQVREVEGVLWLLPVASIKPKERGDVVL